MLRSVTRRRFGALVGAGLLAAPAVVRAQTRPVLKVGLGPQQPTQADTRRVWEPVYKAVADAMGRELDLTVASDWAGISTALANEHIDAAQMGPWGFVLAHVNSGARVVSTMLVNGLPTYRAIMVARPDLEVSNFPEGARGMSLQLMDRGATSGWLIPMHLFKEKGIDPRTHFSRFVEGGNAAAMQLAVANGQVDIAAGWDTHRNTMIRTGNLKPDQNKVVWQSDPIPNECVAVRKGFSDADSAALQKALVELPEAVRKLMPPPYVGFVPGTYDAYRPLELKGRELGVLRTS